MSSPVVTFPFRTKAEESASCNRVRKLDRDSSGRSILQHGVSERETFTTTGQSTDHLTALPQECGGSLVGIDTSSESRRTLQTGPTESGLVSTSVDDSPRPEQFAFAPKNCAATENYSTGQRRALVQCPSGTNSRAPSGRTILAVGPSVTRGEGMGSSPSVDDFSRLPRSRINVEQEGLDSVRPKNNEADGIRKQARDPPQAQWRNRNNPSVRTIPGRQSTEIGGLAGESNLQSFELPPPELPRLDAVMPHGQARGFTQLRNVSARDSVRSAAVVGENVEGVQTYSPRDSSRRHQGNSGDERIVVNSGNDTHADRYLGEPERIDDSLIPRDPLRRRSMTNPASEKALPVEGTPLDTSCDGTNNGESTQPYKNVFRSVGVAVHSTTSNDSVEGRGGGWGLNVSTTPVTTAARGRYANYIFAATPPDSRRAGTNGSQHFGWQ